MSQSFVLLAAGAVLALIAWKVHVRLRLSRAKHPSLRGHIRMSRRLARQVPFYEYDAGEAFAVDGASAEIVERRKAAFRRLSETLAAKAPNTMATDNIRNVNGCLKNDAMVDP